MKNFSFSAAIIAFTLTSGLWAVASPDQVADLNQVAEEILQSFQTSDTYSKINVIDVQSSDERLLSGNLNATYEKTINNNRFSVSVTNLSYVYGASPLSKVNGTFNLDLTKIISQSTINHFMPITDFLAQEYANRLFAKYAEAGIVTAKVSEKVKDVEGNYTSVVVSIYLKIDLTRIPANIAPENVMYTEGKLTLNINFKDGGTFEGYLISNPDYIAFRSDQMGLNEMLKKLQQRDAGQMDKLREIFKTLDDFATEIVNGDLTI